MSLINSAADGLLGSVTTGVFGAVALLWSRHNRRGQLEDAWKKQADELDERLTAQNKAERDWLRGELKKRDAQMTAKDLEIGRLNRIITRERGGAND